MVVIFCTSKLLCSTFEDNYVFILTVLLKATMIDSDGVEINEVDEFLSFLWGVSMIAGKITLLIVKCQIPYYILASQLCVLKSRMWFTFCSVKTCPSLSFRNNFLWIL